MQRPARLDIIKVQMVQVFILLLWNIVSLYQNAFKLCSLGADDSAARTKFKDKPTAGRRVVVPYELSSLLLVIAIHQKSQFLQHIQQQVL